ncbi:MAG: hypothetical protein Q6352_008595 [Candidatus Freyrarchaeum guaymaensis]
MHTTYPEFIIRAAAFLFSNVEGLPGMGAIWSSWTKNCVLFTVHTSVDHDIDLEYCVKNDVAVPFRAPLVVAWLG